MRAARRRGGDARRARAIQQNTPSGCRLRKILPDYRLILRLAQRVRSAAVRSAVQPRGESAAARRALPLRARATRLLHAP